MEITSQSQQRSWHFRPNKRGGGSWMAQLNAPGVRQKNPTFPQNSTKPPKKPTPTKVPGKAYQNRTSHYHNSGIGTLCQIMEGGGSSMARIGPQACTKNFPCSQKIENTPQKNHTDKKYLRKGVPASNKKPAKMSFATTNYS